MPTDAAALAPTGSDLWGWERGAAAAGWPRVAGVDEAGRGPLAGPVVAAAVILPEFWRRDGLPGPLAGLNDSKKLSLRQRERFFAALRDDPRVVWSVAEADVDEIDRLNILGATHLAMRRAVESLSAAPDHVLVDGLPARGLGRMHTAVVRGDGRSYSIAAASVLAKVTRDRAMIAADGRWPGYGFAKHKGYPTGEHLEALARLGPCPWHRRSFGPVRQLELPWAG